MVSLAGLFGQQPPDDLAELRGGQPPIERRSARIPHDGAQTAHTGRQGGAKGLGCRHSVHAMTASRATALTAHPKMSQRTSFAYRCA